MQSLYFKAEQGKLGPRWDGPISSPPSDDADSFELKPFFRLATNCLMSSSLKSSRLQTPPYSFPMSIYIFDTK